MHYSHKYYFVRKNLPRISIRFQDITNTIKVEKKLIAFISDINEENRTILKQFIYVIVISVIYILTRGKFFLYFVFKNVKTVD